MARIMRKTNRLLLLVCTTVHFLSLISLLNGQGLSDQIPNLGWFQRRMVTAARRPVLTTAWSIPPWRGAPGGLDLYRPPVAGGTAPIRAGQGSTADWYRSPLGTAACSDMARSDWSIFFCLNSNLIIWMQKLVVLIVWGQKNWKQILKIQISSLIHL
jgi:hypothetical protein